jgi:[acyl-carrier-protein] S-malonyltransferase
MSGAKLTRPRPSSRASQAASTEDAAEPASALMFPGQGIAPAAIADTLTACGSAPMAVRLGRYLGSTDWGQLDYADTRVLQPAMFTASLCRARLMAPEGVSVALGHSLGEITALAYAGALTEAAAFELVVRRAEFCHEENLKFPGRMVALIGADAARAEWLRRQAAARTGQVIEVAAWNNSSQVVLSGAPGAVDQLVSLAGEEGVIAAPLPIAGAFHSPLMSGAAERFAAYLRDVPVCPAAVETFSTILCRPLRTPEDARLALVMGLVVPVRWAESLRILLSRGVPRGYETGPGVTLTKISKRVGGAAVRSLEGRPDG